MARRPAPTAEKTIAVVITKKGDHKVHTGERDADTGAPGTFPEGKEIEVTEAQAISLEANGFVTRKPAQAAG